MFIILNHRQIKYIGEIFNHNSLLIIIYGDWKKNSIRNQNLTKTLHTRIKFYLLKQLKKCWWEDEEAVDSMLQTDLISWFWSPWISKFMLSTMLAFHFWFRNCKVQRGLSMYGFTWIIHLTNFFGLIWWYCAQRHWNQDVLQSGWLFFLASSEKLH